MTSEDTLIIDDLYHAPSYIKNLQHEIISYLHFFDGEGFYNWAKENNFQLHDIGGHPLEYAHSAAFDYIKTHYNIK